MGNKALQKGNIDPYYENEIIPAKTSKALAEYCFLITLYINHEKGQ